MNVNTVFIECFNLNFIIQLTLFKRRGHFLFIQKSNLSTNIEYEPKWFGDVTRSMSMQVVS